MTKINIIVLVCVIALVGIGGAALYTFSKQGPSQNAATQEAGEYASPTPSASQETPAPQSQSQAANPSNPSTSVTVTSPDISVVAEPVKKAATPSATAPQNATITYTDNGFSPQNITITAGTKVIFKNASSGDFWPASGIHPTHDVYPGSSITKCGTPDAATIFDSCGQVPSGSSWSFVFTQKGSWPYHNHLNAGFTGTITVE